MTDNEMKNANLNKINDRLLMYFELDENGNPFAIKTNSRSKKLESKIITLFKDYDSKKLKFVEKHPLNR